ncbi:MAG: hypothetical protein IT288_18505 [Bdellovibrionales bacterium]|nr:hypothetical protein [Bdellovibrionales bacterium]
MRAVLYLTTLAMLTSGCSTLDQSFRLGAATGAMAGAAATYAAGRAAGGEPKLKDVGIGASIGLGIGLLTSYFVHQSVVEDRESSTRQTEIYFGDLPPSPFVIPNSNKRGGR